MVPSFSYSYSSFIQYMQSYLVYFLFFNVEYYNGIGMAFVAGMLMDLLSPLFPSAFSFILCLGSLSRAFSKS